MKIVLVTLLLSCFGFAQAKTHHIDFTKELIGVDGKPIIQQEADANGKPKAVSMTLGDAAVVALENMLEEDRGTPANVKFERDQLARKIWKNKDAALPVEDIATIKDRIGRVFGPGIVGASWKLLDPSLTEQPKPSDTSTR